MLKSILFTRTALIYKPKQPPYKLIPPNTCCSKFSTKNNNHTLKIKDEHPENSNKETLNNLNVNYDEDFIPVYHFPYIKSFAVVNKLKKYQTLLTGTSMPLSLVLNQLGIMPVDILQLTYAIGISGCIVLCTAGWFTSKFIGIIYYNAQADAVRISYVDFWGNRKNVDMPANDIIPVNELPRTPMDSLYYTFRRYSSKDKLKLCLRYGNVLNNELIHKVI